MDGITPEKRETELERSTRSELMSSTAFVTKFGRGRTGGSLMLEFCVERARGEERQVIIADGDMRNPTLSTIYPVGSKGGALRPVSEETADGVEFITGLIGTLACDRVSLVLDLGGGDRLMSESGRDFAIDDFCRSAGISGVAFHMCGSEMDDFSHIRTIWRSRVFRPEHCFLVFNEHLVAGNRTAIGAFEPIMALPEFAEMVGEGMVPIFMPRLPCVGILRSSGLTLGAAMRGLPGTKGPALDPVRQFMVKSWYNRMVAEFERVGSLGCLP